MDRQKDRGTEKQNERFSCFLFSLACHHLPRWHHPIDPAVAIGGGNTGPIWRFIQPPFEWQRRRQLHNKTRRRWRRGCLVFFLKWKCDDTCDESRGSLGKSRVLTAGGKGAGGHWYIFIIKTSSMGRGSNRLVMGGCGLQCLLLGKQSRMLIEFQISCPGCVSVQALQPSKCASFVFEESFIGPSFWSCSSWILNTGCYSRC